MNPSPYPPAFLFYVDAWRGSRRVQAMSFAERGMYFELLCEQWQHGAAPSSPDTCAEQFGGDQRAWRKAWPKLISCFVARKKDGKLFNKKLKNLAREREEQFRLQSDAGRYAAKQRWTKAVAASKGDANRMRIASRRHANRMQIQDKTIQTRQGNTNKTRQRKSKPRQRTRKQPRARANARATTALVAPSRATESDARFECFWSSFPKRVKRDDAWNAFDRLNPDDVTVAQMLQALEWQRQQPEWLREGGRYIPTAAKWIDDRRWTDEPTDVPHLASASIRIQRGIGDFVGRTES